MIPDEYTEKRSKEEQIDLVETIMNTSFYAENGDPYETVVCMDGDTPRVDFFLENHWHGVVDIHTNVEIFKHYFLIDNDVFSTETFDLDSY